MPTSTRTYKDASGANKTRVVGENGSSQDSGAVVLTDEDAAVLKGQKARTASLPVALSTEDAALLADILTDTTFSAKDFATSAKQDTGNTSLASIDTAIAALSKAEDAAHSSGDKGVMLLAVRKDTAAALAGTDGDYIPVIVDANGRLHTLAGNFPSTVDTNSGNKSASTLRVVLATDQPALTNAQPVTPQAGELHLGEIGGNLVQVTATFTRPADTTAYTAGDVVSNSTSSTTPISFANFARVNQGKGYIVGARLTTDKKSITPRMWVHLYNANTATLSSDNAAVRHKYADESLRIGSFQLPAMTTGADTTNSDMSASADYTIRIPFTAAASTRTIYAVLETIDAFTPASGENFSLTLLGELY